MNQQQLVELLRQQGIHNQHVLQAMLDVPRQLFVDAQHLEYAYENIALPIGCKQTISQPFVVARMTELLLAQPVHTVLEIGTGSGYQAAILAKLVKQVYTIERHKRLYEQAKKRLDSLKMNNVQCLHSDGMLGWAEHAPFDGILVTAAAYTVPPVLLAQLADNGRMIIPLGDSYSQSLTLITKYQGEIQTSRLDPVIFVPLLGGKK